jgi:PPK2 family polyphosphate:nucleotide phosphotransferase
MLPKNIIERLRVRPGKAVHLKDFPPAWAPSEFKRLRKDAIKQRARELLDTALAELGTVQELLYADDRYSVLVVLQAMDAAGKDGTIKHVMSGVNPQGCQVFSFRRPSAEELQHDFLWRYSRCLPERGRIGIFNRSYYEDTLVVKVHPELLQAEGISPEKSGKSLWAGRYEDINAFEQHLTRNGTVILKFFLNISKKEQKRRLLERLERPEKMWKFSANDLAERSCWSKYMKAYEDALSATSTPWAPWYVIPADHKWVARAAVADILTTTISSLQLKFPEPTVAERRALAQARKRLEKE